MVTMTHKFESTMCKEFFFTILFSSALKNEFVLQKACKAVGLAETSYVHVLLY